MICKLHGTCLGLQISFLSFQGSIFSFQALVVYGTVSNILNAHPKNCEIYCCKQPGCSTIEPFPLLYFSHVLNLWQKNSASVQFTQKCFKTIFHCLKNGISKQVLWRSKIKNPASQSQTPLFWRVPADA